MRSSDDETRAAGLDDLQREVLLSQVITAVRDGGAAALDALCNAHPERAVWLRRQVDFLSQLGLLGAAPAVLEPRALGDFDLLGCLGGGGMGVVYRGWQRSLRREVAVKVIRPEFLSFEHARQRFAREVDAVAKLQHPALVRLYAAGEDRGVPFLAMELLVGRTLAEVVESQRQRPVAARRGTDLVAGSARSWPLAVAELFLAVADGLCHAHERGVYHRDLKPSNVFVCSDGRPVVIDFGLAIGDGDARITRTLTPLGSLPYCSPERLRGALDASQAHDDVYGFGATLFELLTGLPPFGRGDALTVRRAILRGEVAAVRTLNPVVPRDLAVICETAIAPRRRRYASMAALAADLRACLAGERIAARPMGAIEVAVRWCQRHAVSVLAALLLTTVLVGGPLALLANERVRAAEGRPMIAAATAEDLLARSEAMWPTSAQWLNSRDGYAEWIRTAEGLVAASAEFSAARDALRLRAVRVARGAPGHEHRFDRLADELEELEATDAWIVKHMVYGQDARQVPLRARVAQIEAELRDELGFAFVDPSDERRHAVLVRLLAKVQRIESLLPAMRGRMARAQQIAALEAQHAPAAEQVADALQRGVHSAYGCLEFRPQPGLLSLGPDPVSGLLEFAHLASGEPPVRDASGRLLLTEDSGIVLVLLSGGAFRMGAAVDDPWNCDPDADLSEAPCRLVVLAPFLIAKHELTQAQWVRAMGLNPAIMPPGSGADANPCAVTALHPVEDITWWEAKAALDRLGLTLPSEAQWEYAARGGTCGAWIAWTGDQLACAANLAGTADGWALHAPVGSFAPNPFGLFDVLGNVSEWCLDGAESYRVDPSPGNGQRMCRPDCPRVVRGGSWSSGIKGARVSTRPTWPPGSALADVGVRPVMRLR